MTEPKILAISHIERPYANPTKDHATGRTAVGIPVAAMPKGMTLHSLHSFFDEYRHRPERRRGTVRLMACSFVDYVKRFRNPDTTVMFVSRWILWHRVTVVFNYHPASPEDTETGFADFRCITWCIDYKKIAHDLNMTGWLCSV